MESNVNERFKLLINTLELSQLEASKRINATPTTVGKWYRNETPIRKSNVQLICKVFHCSEVWLKEGRGEMFLEGVPKFEKKAVSWKDEAYTKMEQYNESLKQEIAFLKSIVTSYLPAQKSFNSGAGVVGFLHKKISSSVRVSK